MSNDDWESFKKDVIPISQRASSRKFKEKKKTITSKTKEKTQAIDLTFPENNPPNPSILEKNTLRKIKRGKIVINSTLDLHGYTVSESKEKVIKFILDNFTKQKRLLLIITGKGTRLPTSGGWKGLGKLKKNVPIWLRSVELSQYILWHDYAAPEKGGEGAIMVYLKKLKDEL